MNTQIGTLVVITFTGNAVRNDVIRILEKYASDTLLFHTLRNRNNSECITFFYTTKINKAIKKLAAISDNPRRNCQYTQTPLINEKKFMRKTHIAINASRYIPNSLIQQTVIDIFEYMQENGMLLD